MTSRVFFFSSRRRHTRWPRDWSSDVCSSDLNGCHSTPGEFGFLPFCIGKQALIVQEPDCWLTCQSNFLICAAPANRKYFSTVLSTLRHAHRWPHDQRRSAGRRWCYHCGVVPHYRVLLGNDDRAGNPGCSTLWSR